MGRDGRMGNDEQWMLLALAVLKRAEGKSGCLVSSGSWV